MRASAASAELAQSQGSRYSRKSWRSSSKTNFITFTRYKSKILWKNIDSKNFMCAWEWRTGKNIFHVAFSFHSLVKINVINAQVVIAAWKDCLFTHIYKAKVHTGVFSLLFFFFTTTNNNDIHFIFLLFLKFFENKVWK